MATQASIDKVNLMYVAYYGRPGDPGGVEFWADVLDVNGGELTSSIIAAFGTSAEFTDRFGSLSDEELIDNLYLQMFNRTADAEGKAFYLEQIALGNMTLGDAALDIANGAQGSDLTILNNKINVAGYFTEQVAATGTDYTAEDIDDASAIIAAITDDPITVVTQKDAVDEFLSVTTLFELTTGQDVVVGTPGDDVINGIIGDDEDSNNITTFNSFDVIDGGDGYDILNLVVNENYTITPDMNSVEEISLRVLDDSAASLDFTTVSDVTTIGLHDVPNNDADVYVWNINELIDTVKFTNVARDSDSVWMELEFGNTVGTGSDDILQVHLDNAGYTMNGSWEEAASLDVTNSSGEGIYENLYIHSTGSLNNNLFWYEEATSATDAALEKVMITGDANLYFSFDWDTETLDEVDASTFGANLKMDMGGFDKGITLTSGIGDDDLVMGTEDDTVSSGDGDDNIDITSGGDDTVDAGAGDDTVDATGALDTNDSLDGGAGTDTIVVDNAMVGSVDGFTNDALAAFQATISNFESLGVGDYLTNDIDLTRWTDINHVELRDGASTVTIDALGEGGTVTVWDDVNSITVNFDDTSADDDELTYTAVITDDESYYAGWLESDDVEVLNFAAVSDGDTDDDFISVGISLDDLVELNISGDVTTLSVTNDFADASDTLETVNASAFTGDLTIDLSGVVGPLSVTTGSGDDSIIGGQAGDTIDAGDGDDVIEGGTGADTLTGGDGEDEFIFDVPVNGNSYDTVTDAEADDILTLIDMGTETFAASAITLANTAAFRDYLDAAAAGDGSTNGAISWFQYEGDTYVVEDLAAAASFQDGVDAVIKLTGMVDLSEATLTGNSLTI